MTSPLHAQAQLATQIGTVIQQAIQGRRRYVETLAEQTVKDGRAVGFVELESSGPATAEVVVEVTFPQRFYEVPIFAPGLSLRDRQWLAYGTFPTWSATVASWITDEVAESTLYVGALIAVVITNTGRSLLHYQFSARSFTTPVTPGTTVTEPL